MLIKFVLEFNEASYDYQSGRTVSQMVQPYLSPSWHSQPRTDQRTMHTQTMTQLKHELQAEGDHKTMFTWFDGSHDSSACTKDSLVYLPLVLSELPIGREGARDVWRVTVVLAAHVKQAE